MISDFTAPAGFFDTSDDHGPLVARTASVEDNALPSGNSMAAFVLLRLSALAAEPPYADLARRSLRQVHPLLSRQPLGLGQWLTALDFALADVCQVAVVGDPSASDAAELINACRREFRPHQVVAAGQAGAVGTPALLAVREQAGGRATAHVCAGSTCLPPTTDAAQLDELLRRHCGRGARSEVAK